MQLHFTSNFIWMKKIYFPVIIQFIHFFFITKNKIPTHFLDNDQTLYWLTLLKIDIEFYNPWMLLTNGNTPRNNQSQNILRLQLFAKVFPSTHRFDQCSWIYKLHQDHAADKLLTHNIDIAEEEGGLNRAIFKIFEKRPW